MNGIKQRPTLTFINIASSLRRFRRLGGKNHPRIVVCVGFCVHPVVSLVD